MVGQCAVVLLGALTMLLAPPDTGPGPSEQARPTQPRVTAEAFQYWFRAATRGRLHVPDPVAERAREFRYVFVGGFEMRRMPGYFAQNVQALRSLGVPRRSIHVFVPDSDHSVEENREPVRAEILRVAALGPERLVLIGHSRGACGTLTFALANPAFVRDRVAAIFLVQGAFGGSGLADYLLGDGRPVDDRMSRLHRVIVRAFTTLELHRIRDDTLHGLATMERDASHAYWRRLLKNHGDVAPIIGPKVYYVTASTRPRRLSFFQRVLAWYLGAYYGPNDGVVALADQTVEGIGTDLGPLCAGHSDLVRGRPASRKGRRWRAALVRCIVMTVDQRTALRHQQAPKSGRPTLAPATTPDRPRSIVHNPKSKRRKHGPTHERH